MNLFQRRLDEIRNQYNKLIATKNEIMYEGNGIYRRYQYPILTRDHIPFFWKYDLNPIDNPYFMERFSVNSTFNSGAIKWNDKYILIVRVESVDRKSFFAIAESDSAVDEFVFRDYPINLPELDTEETNVYDMRLTAHEDGWIYGIFCSESADEKAQEGDFSSAIASSGIVRTKDLHTWERLPNLISNTQQRNVVLHPELVSGKYAFYTRPQDGFIEAGKGSGIGWGLVDDITNPFVSDEEIINERQYHSIKESKNGEGPTPIKTRKGWLHLAHGVRNCAAGLRYVLYLYLTDLEKPWKVIAEPAGYFMAPIDGERVGDVSNVLFSNGWIADDDGKVYIYYASCDTRMHVAESSIEQLLDYCLNTRKDEGSSQSTVKALQKLIMKNMNENSI